MREKKLKTLTRADIAEAITKEFRVTKFNASEIVEDVLDEIAAALANGENVKIAGFGTFLVRDKKERIGCNPRTLEKAIITARKSLSFRASNVLKNAVKEEINS
jgi:integration host factor subunit alpha